MDEPPPFTPSELFSFLELASPSFLVAAAILLLISAVISAAEVAFVSILPNEVDTLKSSHHRRARTMLSLLEDHHSLWLSLVIINLLLKVSVVTLLSLFWSFHSSWPLGAIIVTTSSVILCISEILPKTFARQHPVRLFQRLAPGLKWCLVLIKPVSSLLTQVKSYWSRSQVEKRTNSEGLSQALALAAGMEGTSPSEKDILKGIANFGTLTVKQVMRTRSEISAIHVKLNFSELMEAVNKSGFSRIPVYDTTLDTIVGVLYIKDLLPFLEDQVGFEWQSLLRPGMFVHENKKIDLLLKDFQEKRVHMAIVMGEFGGTMGLVTLEDLIEEIIGEINDEFDEVEHLYKRIDDRTYVFDGKSLLPDFCKALDIDPATFREISGGQGTLSHLMVALHKKNPLVGDQILFDALTFIIESVDRRGIKRVRVKIHEQAQ